MFVHAEAIATFEYIFAERRISPKCLIHTRPGTGFGGNFSEYPEKLGEAFSFNQGGLPRFILHGPEGSDRLNGDYLPIIGRYREIHRWGYYANSFGYTGNGCLILAELPDDDALLVNTTYN